MCRNDSLGPGALRASVADASDLPDPDTGAPDDTAADTGGDRGPAPTDTDPSDTDPADTDPADAPDPADTDPAPSGCAAVPGAFGAALGAIPLVVGRRRPCGSRRA